MNNGKVQWEGNFVAVVTPFTESGEIDEAAFGENIALLLDEGAEGIIVSGCTGEAWALSPEERLRLFQLGVDTADRAVPVIAGTGGISTRDVIELSEKARDVGCNGIMVLPPYYCRPGSAEVVAHYKGISDAVGVPILLYNIPQRTGVDLGPDLLEELIALEYVVAIKESSDSFIRVETLVNQFGNDIQVFTGHSAERGVAAIVMGAKGWVSSLESQIMGREAVQMYDMVKNGDLEGGSEKGAASNVGTRSGGAWDGHLPGQSESCHERVRPPGWLSPSAVVAAHRGADRASDFAAGSPGNPARGGYRLVDCIRCLVDTDSRDMTGFAGAPGLK